MALQLWEILKESIVAFTGLSPETFFTVLALGLAGLFGSLRDRHQRPRDYQEQMQPLPPPVQLVETSEDKLKQYDGTDPKKSLLANRGQIYDVSQRRRSYDVFLSFRGTDVRNSFLSHLYIALVQSGINTYMDNEDLKKGEQISTALMEAIEESQIAIVVFSKNYASSLWCLEEVAKIMECKEQRGLMVFPVFYKVEPREVRRQRQDYVYTEAMAKHEVKFGKDSEKVKRWKKALLDAGSLSGWPFMDGVEAELIKEIVSKISMQIDQRLVHVADHLIGIRPRLIELNSMLKLGSDEDVRMIGLWGPGGIGKTTLGLALYNNISRQFEGSCFLADVCKALEGPKDLAALQKQLLSDIFPGRKLVVSDIHKGISLMQNNLYRKKVLLVLDNVIDRSQLYALAGNLEWFGAGSRIIFTTRDKHLLISHRIKEDYIYEVKPLNDRYALGLLCQHAFPSNINIRMALVDRVLRYANGHPLTLVRLGHYLYCRNEHDWESSLNILGKILINPSNDTFKWSYDGLDDNAKEICLDIACFFRGYSKEYTMKVLDSCNFESTIGLKVLVEKSFITEEGGTLQISNNMIQLMAMDSARQKYPTRLWLLDDFRNVLSGHLVATALQSIVLILPKPEKINIGPNALTNLRMLKKLIMKNVHNSFQDPIYLPNELKWFEWPECRPRIPKSSPESTKLDLHKSNIQALLRKQFEGPKKLESNNFSECPSLVYVPTFDFQECTFEYLEDKGHTFENLNDGRTFGSLEDLSSFPSYLESPFSVSTLSALSMISSDSPEMEENIFSPESMEDIFSRLETKVFSDSPKL